MKIRSINPHTEQVIHECDPMTPDEIDLRIARARQASSSWGRSPASRRALSIKRLAGVLRENQKRFADLITREMGKPIRESRAEIDKCAWLCDYYAEKAPGFLRNERVKTEARKSYVTFQPLGVVLAIMPWNFPFWQPFRFAVPSLAAGNCCLMKHASNVSLTALAIEDAFRQAGFPENVFTTLIINADAAMNIIEEDKVDAVSLTGSSRAGEQVGALAGGRIKKLVLELGGSDPFVVLDDADVAKAGTAAAKARTINTGQSCIAAKRFIVGRKVVKEFTDLMIRQLKLLKIGDPLDEATDIGPVARRDILDTLRDQLDDARSKGGDIRQVEYAADRGFFFAPCVVLCPRPDMRILSEEVFGPIAPILEVKNAEEAVKAANATPFGLGASVWSRNTRGAEEIARRIEAGFVAVNDIVKSDPRLPFGGIKKSGVGRELSEYGLREFVNIKSVVVRE